ncbi:hypothetical protein ACHAW5_000792 [Stephanodiscus triporus]|uniref:Secreted protein n=1 Tax=Stephanodiscus triporus TaxID=2934178 RepID=A0ABD3QFK4_9STRA
MDLLHMSLFLGNAFIIAVYFCFGFFQSTGGPVGRSYFVCFQPCDLRQENNSHPNVLLSWVTGFCDKKSIENRGLIFGLWTCHQYCGDITQGRLYRLRPWRETPLHLCHFDPWRLPTLAGVT